MRGSELLLLTAIQMQPNGLFPWHSFRCAACACGAGPTPRPHATASIQDSGVAKKLAFSRDVNMRCVTLDGDDFNPSGVGPGPLQRVSDGRQLMPQLGRGHVHQPAVSGCNQSMPVGWFWAPSARCPHHSLAMPPQHRDLTWH